MRLVVPVPWPRRLFTLERTQVDRPVQECQHGKEVLVFSVQSHLKYGGKSSQ